MSNVRLLFFAQMLTGVGLTSVVLFGGLLGAELAPSASWATLPVSVTVVGMALSTVPAALLMRVTGRRLGLIAGASVGVFAATLCAWAIARRSFALFCCGAILFGTATAFTQQYRFVAAESVGSERASRAISFVLLGSLGAALAGPQIAMAARWLIAGHEYAGSFLSVGVLYVLGAIVLCWLRPTGSATVSIASRGLSVAELLREPMLRRAMLAGGVAFAVMSFIMTAAPVSMHSVHHHSAGSVTWTIQSHILAMYLPSLFSGRLAARFGERAMMIAGSALLGASVVVNVAGQQVTHYWVGLVLLGMGWNLLFVAGTSLLATHYTGAERHRAQAINDFIVFASQACVSLLAGLAVQNLGWVLLNLSVLPLLALVALMATRRVEPPRRVEDQGGRATVGREAARTAAGEPS
jgi:MFS family permease